MTRLPRVAPIRPVFAKPFDGSEWSFEFKYDGFRGILYAEDGIGRFLSRQDKVLHRFDGLATSIATALKVKDVILDGEIIAKDETERPIFEHLIRHTGTPSYVAFDLMWLNGRDVRDLSLTDRRKLLRRLAPRASPMLELPLAEAKIGRTLYELMCQYDLEGVIAKRLRDPYLPKTKWYKFKNPQYSQLQGRNRFFRQK